MARMTRTILSLPEDEKKWLESYGRRHRISGAEVIRRAIKEFRHTKPDKDLGTVLRKTAGAWTSVKGDSRDCVDRLRKDWESSS